MLRLRLLLATCAAALGAITPVPPFATGAAISLGPVARVITNDNRRPAGSLRRGVLTLRLEAKLADWHPEGDSADGATVPAFAEEGGAARIPGPLIRVRSGTQIALTIRNSLGQRLTVHGLSAPSRSGRRAGKYPGVDRARAGRIEARSLHARRARHLLLLRLDARADDRLALRR